MSIENYFDKNWENVKFSDDKEEQVTVIFSFIKKYLNNKNLNYFEFGCGNCYVTNFLFNHLQKDYENINFTVSDISSVGLSYCSSDFEKIVVSKNKMSFENLYNSMDVVTSFEVFEHLDKDLEEFYLNELINISKDYIIIGVPYQERLEKRNVVCKECEYDGHIYGHLRSYNKDMFSNLFKGKAELIEYNLCGVNEEDFPKGNYNFAQRIGYQILEYTCPNCTKEQSNLSFFNRVRNKFISIFIFNKLFFRQENHPFWIVGVFKKVVDEKK